jgi:hypothetical protein
VSSTQDALRPLAEAFTAAAGSPQALEAVYLQAAGQAGGLGDDQAVRDFLAAAFSAAAAHSRSLAGRYATRTSDRGLVSVGIACPAGLYSLARRAFLADWQAAAPGQELRQIRDWIAQAVRAYVTAGLVRRRGMDAGARSVLEQTGQGPLDRRNITLPADVVHLMDATGQARSDLLITALAAATAATIAAVPDGQLPPEPRLTRAGLPAKTPDTEPAPATA